MALEVLVKGIARAVDNPAGHTHSLSKLAEHVGIAITEDERVLLDVMSEHVLLGRAVHCTAQCRRLDKDLGSSGQAAQAVRQIGGDALAGFQRHVPSALDEVRHLLRQGPAVAL
jgi:hypothetical protein